jgi:hypothetical protein
MEELTETELVNLLKAARTAITEGLANLGVPEDEVEAYGLQGPSLTVFASPALVNRLGPGFAVAGANDCNNLCNGSCNPLEGRSSLDVG